MASAPQTPRLSDTVEAIQRAAAGARARRPRAMEWVVENSEIIWSTNGISGTSENTTVNTTVNAADFVDFYRPTLGSFDTYDFARTDRPPDDQPARPRDERDRFISRRAPVRESPTPDGLAIVSNLIRGTRRLRSTVRDGDLNSWLNAVEIIAGHIGSVIDSGSTPPTSPSWLWLFDRLCIHDSWINSGATHEAVRSLSNAFGSRDVTYPTPQTTPEEVPTDMPTTRTRYDELMNLLRPRDGERRSVFNARVAAIAARSASVIEMFDATGGVEGLDTWPDVAYRVERYPRRERLGADCRLAINHFARTRTDERVPPPFRVNTVESPDEADRRQLVAQLDFLLSDAGRPGAGHMTVDLFSQNRDTIRPYRERLVDWCLANRGAWRHRALPHRWVEIYYALQGPSWNNLDSALRSSILNIAGPDERAKNDGWEVALVPVAAPATAAHPTHLPPDIRAREVFRHLYRSSATQPLGVTPEQAHTHLEHFSPSQWEPFIVDNFGPIGPYPLSYIAYADRIGGRSWDDIGVTRGSLEHLMLLAEIERNNRPAQVATGDPNIIGPAITTATEDTDSDPFTIDLMRDVPASLSIRIEHLLSTIEDTDIEMDRDLVLQILSQVNEIFTPTVEADEGETSIDVADWLTTVTYATAVGDDVAVEDDRW